MARLTRSVRVVQLRIESRLWMEKLEDQLMSASGKLQRGMRWPVKVRFGPFVSFVRCQPQAGEPDFRCDYARGEHWEDVCDWRRGGLDIWKRCNQSSCFQCV